MHPATPLPRHAPQCPPEPVASATLARALAATGTDAFGWQLLNHLQEACGADHCAVFQFGRHAPRELATGSHDRSGTAHARVGAYLERQLWSKDPAMVYANARLDADQMLLMRVDVSHLGDPVEREVVWPRIRDRLVMAGRSRRSTYSISVLREGAKRFTDAEVGRLGSSAAVLVALLAKHAQLRSPEDAAGILASVPAIEDCIGELSALKRREKEVCARILHGMSTTGIAIDLGIGMETVKTFRKLAYRRLAIGSERELLAWYLGLQERWQRVRSERA